MTEPVSTVVILGELARLASDPAVRSLVERLVTSLQAGLRVDLVVSEPADFDPLAEMRAAEATRVPPAVDTGEQPDEGDRVSYPDHSLLEGQS